MWGFQTGYGLYSDEPVFVEDFLTSELVEDDVKRMKTVHYNILLEEIAKTEVEKAETDAGKEIYFQDDHDVKHTSKASVEKKNELFGNAWLRHDQHQHCSKLADLWNIEHRWNACLNYIKGQEFNDLDHMKDALIEAWKHFNAAVDFNRLSFMYSFKAHAIYSKDGAQLRKEDWKPYFKEF